MSRGILPRLSFFRALMPARASIISRPILPITSARLGQPTRNLQSRLFQNFPARLSASELPSERSNIPKLDPNASLSQRLKHLIKSYGWYALGVYLILSAVDFGIAFAGINLIGAEHVARFAASIKQYFMSLAFSKPPEPGKDEFDPVHQPGGSEGLYAMIVLAYTIHKTLFLPFRVGLTAAITPRLVKWLGNRGWTGGAGTIRAAKEIRERVRVRKSRD